MIYVFANKKNGGCQSSRFRRNEDMMIISGVIIIILTLFCKSHENLCVSIDQHQFGKLLKSSSNIKRVLMLDCYPYMSKPCSTNATSAKKAKGYL